MADYIKAEQVINPEHMNNDEFCSATGLAGTGLMQDDPKDCDVADDMARAFNDAPKPIRWHGVCYAYTFDPKDWRNVRVSDGDTIRLEYLSDMGKYDVGFWDLMSYYCEAIRNELYQGDIDQAEFEAEAL